MDEFKFTDEEVQALVLAVVRGSGPIDPEVLLARVTTEVSHWASDIRAGEVLLDLCLAGEMAIVLPEIPGGEMKFVPVSGECADQNRITRGRRVRGMRGRRVRGMRGRHG